MARTYLVLCLLRFAEEADYFGLRTMDLSKTLRSASVAEDELVKAFTRGDDGSLSYFKCWSRTSSYPILKIEVSGPRKVHPNVSNIT